MPLPRGCSIKQALAAAQHDAADAGHLLLRHRLADHREGLLGHLAVGCQIVGAVEVDPVDLGGRHEGLDLQRLGALDLERLEVAVLDQDVLALGDLVALDAIGRVDRLAAHRIDQVLLQAIAGLAVQRVERHALRRRGRVVERDAAGDERQLEVAFPRGTGHWKTPECSVVGILVQVERQVDTKPMSGFVVRYRMRCREHTAVAVLLNKRSTRRPRLSGDSSAHAIPCLLLLGSQEGRSSSGREQHRHRHGRDA